VTRYSLFLTLASIPSSPSTRQQRCGASAFYLLCGHLHQTSGRAATTLAQRSASFTFIHCTASVAPLCPPLAWLHNPGTCGSRCTCPFVAESPAGRAHSVRTTRISHVTRPPLSRPARCYGCWERLQQLREERDLEVSSSAPATLVARYLLALTEADQSQHRTRCWSLFHPLTTSAQTNRNPSLVVKSHSSWFSAPRVTGAPSTSPAQTLHAPATSVVRRTPTSSPALSTRPVTGLVHHSVAEAVGELGVWALPSVVNEPAEAVRYGLPARSTR
jgi:hypothetical protein